MGNRVARGKAGKSVRRAAVSRAANVERTAVAKINKSQSRVRGVNKPPTGGRVSSWGIGCSGTNC